MMVSPTFPAAPSAPANVALAVHWTAWLNDLRVGVAEHATADEALRELDEWAEVANRLPEAPALAASVRYRFATEWAEAPDDLLVAPSGQIDALDDVVVHTTATGVAVLLRFEYRLVARRDDVEFACAQASSRHQLASARAHSSFAVVRAERRLVSAFSSPFAPDPTGT